MPERGTHVSGDTIYSVATLELRWDIRREYLLDDEINIVHGFVKK